MFHNLRTKFAVIAAAIVLPIGTLLTFGSGQALASGYNAQICNSTGCVNAWYGGPPIALYHGMNVVNNHFFVGTLSNGNSYLQFVGGGYYNNYCIADAQNDSGDARAWLGHCPTNTNSGDWGSNFKVERCNPEGTAFKNIHWGGYLAPSGTTSGSQFYLNHNGQYCFGVYPF